MQFFLALLQSSKKIGVGCCYLRIICLAIRSRMEVDDVVFVLVALCRLNGQYKQHDEGMPYCSRLHHDETWLVRTPEK